jgi:hypothetical protein
MKTRNLLLIALFYLWIIVPVVAQPENKAFGTGEKLTYKVYYNLFKLQAGSATFEVREALKKVNGRDCYNIVGTGKTTDACDMFFMVRDHYESYIDAELLMPWRFVRVVNEGGFKFDDYVRFDPIQKTAVSKKQKDVKQPMPDNFHDVLSALYYFRTLDWEKAQEGQVFEVDIFLDDQLYKGGVKYLGKETIKTDLGKVKCLKLQPNVISGNVFKENAKMFLWVTDDENRIPVRIESDIVVGSVKADLLTYENLRNEFTALTGKK